MAGIATVSGNTSYSGGGVFVNGGRFNKQGGTIYGSNETNANLRNTAIQGYAVYDASNNGRWRNSTAGPTMNPEVFGFWLNEETQATTTTFPSTFIGTWRRDNNNLTLTFTTNTVSDNYTTWNLQIVSSNGNVYVMRRNDRDEGMAITIRLVNGNLEISGGGWSGTWRKQ